MSTAGEERFVCIHGHFYQPPRENPWLEAVEVQDSAAPYHDWNERVTAECYAPNAVARLLDEIGRITALHNNYERISFNFGPTLLSWMEQARPSLYAQILAADQASARRYGRGNAIAQVYGHCIMPLAGRRDQQTQVCWGIADFVHRFGRRPDGMWLPETAVDRRTLAVLAENGIRFTILSPLQAARVRYAGGEWQDVHDGRIDWLRPYRCTLDSGLEITIFFYDPGIAHGIAFAGLLNDGRELARRLTAAALAGSAAPHVQPPLVNIATDGESYGHHHRFGEMALAAAIDSIDRGGQAQLTNYAAYLDKVKVLDDVEIHENSSWSCAHGVERWRANCGCNAGSLPGWQQAWRTPLRKALDWLNGKLDAMFEQQGAKVLRDPWAARDAYLTVVLRRDSEEREAFLLRHAVTPVDARARIRLWRLLEMQRYGLLSFTSCGWFFNDPTGIETVQVLSYAARALQLAAECGAHLEPEFLRHLQTMQSNLPESGDGRQLYRHLIRPQVTDPGRVVAHYAMNSLFSAVERETRVYAFRVTSLEHGLERSGATGLAVGRARLRSEATEETCDFTYAALYLGGHDMHCAAAETIQDYAGLQAHLVATFFAEPLTELVRSIDHAFGGVYYTLRHLFVAERRRILDHLTSQLMAACSADYERIVGNNRRLLDFLAQARVPLPQALEVATTYVMQQRLEQAVSACMADGMEAAPVLAVWVDIQRWRITPALERVRKLLEQALVAAVMSLAQADVQSGLVRAHRVLDLAASLGLQLDPWEAQNHYYVLITTAGTRPWSAALVPELRRLGERLSFHLREWDTLTVRAA